MFVKKFKVAVIAFPGNNCETETARAFARNGFESQILRWNQIEEIGKSDVYVLPGGFSFEDRGRSGAVASREIIFDKLREEAKKGKIILGICNGAQMIVESGLIPIAGEKLPLALAHNIRRDENNHVLGTGFYNEWTYLKVENKNTAFTYKIEKNIKIPFAHGEGRFVSQNEKVLENMKGHENVAFRYCDESGNVGQSFPVTPNGAVFATAAVTNKEGTIMAIMPHPERFFEDFDGDQIFQSIKSWLEDNKSPEKVEISDLSSQDFPNISALNLDENKLYIEKWLMITDNENFTVESTAKFVADDKKLELSKSIIFEISSEKKITQEEILDLGIIANLNKEKVSKFESRDSLCLVKEFQSDASRDISDKLSELLNQKIEVKIYKGWDFKNSSKDSVKKILENGLLSNPHSSEIFKV